MLIVREKVEPDVYIPVRLIGLEIVRHRSGFFVEISYSLFFGGSQRSCFLLLIL
jgi:hypothetical protein